VEENDEVAQLRRHEGAYPEEPPAVNVAYGAQHWAQDEGEHSFTAVREAQHVGSLLPSFRADGALGVGLASIGRGFVGLGGDVGELEEQQHEREARTKCRKVKVRSPEE